MLDALSRNGWHNYSLFMREDGLMFGYFEADESFEIHTSRPFSLSHWRLRDIPSNKLILGV